MNFKYYCCFLSDEEQRKIEISNNQKSEEYPWKIYTLKELLRATNNFHEDNQIGEGGFGSVYFGEISKGVQAIIITSFAPHF
ncbi:hypothetical protein Lal_00034378 [Lupinus albus]|nr:hypothetical protein Lal_00034378 [Lupinus albus]